MEEDVIKIIEEIDPKTKEEVKSLTTEQERIITEAFFNKQDAPPSISELIKLAFPNAIDTDGRSKEGRLIKIFLATKDLKAKTLTNYSPRQKVQLSEAQREYVTHNYSTMGPMEMARIIFNNPGISNLHAETRAVAEHIKTLPPKQRTSEEVDEVPTQEYSPPKTIEGALKKIDKYIFAHNFKKESLTASQRACLTALLGYMNTFRFIHQINLYASQTNRNLFESEFVRCSYDKPDLTEEEVNQYIMLSHETVESANIQRRKEVFQTIIDNIAANDGESARISANMVETINTLQNEYNQCVTRAQKILGDLKMKRSDRIEQQKSSNASILNLVQIWKDEKTRKRMIYIAEAKKKELEKAIDELSSLEDVKARIIGLNKGEMLDG